VYGFNSTQSTQKVTRKKRKARNQVI